MTPIQAPFWRRVRALRTRIWWRIRYGKRIAPGTWSRGSRYGRELWARMKADRKAAR